MRLGCIKITFHILKGISRVVTRFDYLHDVRPFDFGREINRIVFYSLKIIIALIILFFIISRVLYLLFRLKGTYIVLIKFM